MYKAYLVFLLPLSFTAMKICSAVLLATGCRCEFSAYTVTLFVFTTQNSCNSMWE